MSLLFYCRHNKDAAADYVAALVKAGYRETYEIEKADFLLLDHDLPGYHASRPYIKAITTKPKFIYAHVPYSYFFWDGIIEPTATLCNFVVGSGAVEAMRIYGYPYRVEAVGFTGCHVQAFQPSRGTKLLFAPAHPVHDGKYPNPESLTQIQEASQKILDNLSYFESVTIRYANSLKDCGLEAFEGAPVIFEHIEPYTTPNIRQDALASIACADLVISQCTFGYLAIASGKPTLFYGYRDAIPNTREGYVKHYDTWKHIFHFPLIFEDMPIDDILAMRWYEGESIANWKYQNIGHDFAADKFIEIVRECL